MKTLGLGLNGDWRYISCVGWFNAFLESGIGESVCVSQHPTSIQLHRSLPHLAHLAHSTLKRPLNNVKVHILPICMRTLFWHTWSRRNPKGSAVVAKSFIGMPFMKVFSNCHHTYLEEDDVEDDFVEVVPCLTEAEE